MSRFKQIEDPVLVDGDGSETVAYLTAKVNSKTVGIPIVNFTTNNLIELMDPTMNLNLKGSTFWSPDGNASAVPYGANSEAIGVAVTIGASAFCLPIFQIDQDNSDVITLELMKPTLVGGMSALENPDTDNVRHMLFSVDGSNYGFPLFNYGQTYNPKTNTFTTLSSLPAPSGVETIWSVGKPTLDIENNHGSTSVNSKIVAYSDLIRRVKMHFGYPSVNVEICDENISEFIDASIELYSKYAGYDEEFLVFNTSQVYEKGKGMRLDKLFTLTSDFNAKSYEGNYQYLDYDLKDYRKVIGIHDFQPGEATGVNTLFTIENTLAQQTFYSALFSGYGFDLVTWTTVKTWLKDRAKVLATNPYIRFNPRTQYMKILPEPYYGNDYMGVVGCYVEKPIRELISEKWVEEYTTALLSISLGRLRSKYQMTLPGGAQINGNDLLSFGTQQKKELEEQLWKGTGFVEGMPPMFFHG